MEDKGLSPIPVIHHIDHYGMEPSIYLDNKGTVIAYGPRDDIEYIKAHDGDNWLYTRLNNHGYKCHLMGSASIKTLARHIIHSSDAKTWKEEVYRRNNVSFLTGDGKVKKIPVHRSSRDSFKNNFSGVEPELQDEFEAFLSDTFGMSLDQFFERSNEGSKQVGLNAYVVNMYFYGYELPIIIDREHAKNGWNTFW